LALDLLVNKGVKIFGLSLSGMPMLVS
jgi:hypothetical protein